MRRVRSHPFRNAALLLLIAAFAGEGAHELVPVLVREIAGDAPALRVTGGYAWAPEDAILLAFAHPLGPSEQARVFSGQRLSGYGR